MEHLGSPLKGWQMDFHVAGTASVKCSEKANWKDFSPLTMKLQSAPKAEHRAMKAICWHWKRCDPEDGPSMDLQNIRTNTDVLSFNSGQTSLDLGDLRMISVLPAKRALQNYLWPHNVTAICLLHWFTIGRCGGVMHQFRASTG